MTGMSAGTDRRERCRKVLQSELGNWASLSPDDLLNEIRNRDVYEVVEGPNRYQIEVVLLENTPEYLHVSIAVDDGSLRVSFRPEADSFICRKA